MITKRQYKIISFFLTRSLFLGLGISRILKLAKNDAWIACILGAILGLLIISLIYKLKKNFELGNNLDNSFRGKLVKLVLFLFASFCLHDVIISLTTMASSFFLTLTPPLLIGISVLLIVIYGNYKKISTFAKVAELLLPLSVIIFGTKFISCFFITDYNNFLPIFYGQKSGVLKAAVSFGVLSSAPYFLLLTIKGVDVSYKEHISGYLWGSLTIMFTISSITGVLGSSLSFLLRYPEYIILKKIKIFNFIENIENILTFTWLFDLTILGLMSGYNIKKILKTTFKKKGVFTSTYLLWLIAILVVGVFVFNEHYTLTLSLYKYDVFILLGFILVLLVIIGLLKIKKNKVG